LWVSPISGANWINCAAAGACPRARGIFVAAALPFGGPVAVPLAEPKCRKHLKAKHTTL
jgi:hypothetical protein